MISANNPELRSFIDVPENSDFPIQNLPWGVFRSKSQPAARPCVGVAIGHQILNVTLLEQKKLIQTPTVLFQEGSLNLFMEQEPQVWSDIREQLSCLLRSDCGTNIIGEPHSIPTLLTTSSRFKPNHSLPQRLQRR